MGVWRSWSSGPHRLGPGFEQCCPCPLKSCGLNRWLSFGAGVTELSPSATRCCYWRKDWVPVPVRITAWAQACVDDEECPQQLGSPTYTEATPANLGSEDMDINH